MRMASSLGVIQSAYSKHVHTYALAPSREYVREEDMYIGSHPPSVQRNLVGYYKDRFYIGGHIITFPQRYADPVRSRE